MIALLIVAALALVLASPASAETTAPPVADSYVDATAASSNFGRASTLQADGSPLKRIFMKFDLTGAAAPASAALRVYANGDNPTGFVVRSVSDTTWGETTINHGNAPALGEVVASSGPVTGGNWYTLDVSPLASSGGVVGLAIITPGSKALSLASRESARSPQLVSEAPASPSPFAVRRDGSTYHAESQTTSTAYSGTLKSVVESAVVDLNRAGGGTIRFGSGEFDLGNSQWELHDMVAIRFEGQGIDATVIRNSMSSTSFDTEPFDVASAWRTVIRDMTVIAGGPARSTSDAIDFDGGNDTLIERVKITGSRGRGIVFDGKDVVGGVARTADNNVVRDCVISGVPGDGIELLAASSNRIEGCTITNTGVHGIQLTKASSSAGQPHKTSNDNVIAGNSIDNAGQDGINVTSGDRNEILANTITNSANRTSGRDGIRITGSDSKTCHDSVVSNNAATDTQATKTQRYGLAIASSLCHRTLVLANNFEGNKSGAISDQGIDTRYSAPGEDTEPPSIPSGLTATAVAHDRIDLSWGPASDDVAVSGYTIYRDGSAIATVGAATVGYGDGSVAPSTAYTYTVDAFDAAGHHSAQSTSASAATPAGPTVFTFTPTADAYVNETSPTSNYGGASTLRTDGSPIVRSYLRFDVQNVTGPIATATLRVYASSGSTAGHDVRGVADSIWSESTINYSNAPAFGAVVGSSGPFTAGRYVEVDVTPLVTGDGPISLVLTGPGTTAISYGSRESANQPQLVIEAG
jgi:parallel beta-helix repeat protein